MSGQAREREAFEKWAANHNYGIRWHNATQAYFYGSTRIAWEAWQAARAAAWIPVSERLPEDGVPVIVHGGVAEFRFDGWWTYMECPRRRIQWEVTAWQPLPAPPLAQAGAQEGKRGAADRGEGERR